MFIGKALTFDNIIDKLTYRLARGRSDLKEPCTMCGSKTHIEIHHDRKLKPKSLKKDWLNNLMTRVLRKQIPLFRSYHQTLRRGTLNEKPKKVYTNSIINIKNLFIGFLILVIIGEHFFFLNQIEELQKEIQFLKTNQINLEEKPNPNMMKKGIFIISVIAVSAILIMYFSGFDSGNAGKELNSFGNSITELILSSEKSLAEKLTEVNSSQLDHMTKLNEKFGFLEEKLLKVLTQISHQVINLNKNYLAQSDALTKFNKPTI